MITLVFGIFDPIGFLLCLTMFRLTAEKFGLSLSHLVQEILEPKVGLIFHQNVLFNSFEAFYINFLLDFRSK